MPHSPRTAMVRYLAPRLLRRGSVGAWLASTLVLGGWANGCGAGAASGMARDSQAQGVLQGRVTIGPVCPVEKQPIGGKSESCTAPPGAYSGRKVLVFTPNH